MATVAVDAGTLPDDTTSIHTSTTSRQFNWDLIRVIAIGEVLIFHMTFLGPATKPGIPDAPFAWSHPFGASTLLVVSGYFAARTMCRYSAREWLARRLIRLLPAYFIAVLTVFTLMRVFGPDDLDLHHLTYGDLIGNLLLMQQLLPNVDFVDVSYWTLPVQVGGFTAMALLARHPAVRRHAAAVLWAVLLIPLAVRWIWMGHGPAMWLVVATEGTGLCRAHLLVAGVAIWMWSQRKLGSTHLLLMLGSVLVAQKVHPPMGNSIPLLAAMLGLICLAAGRPDWTLPGLHLIAHPIRWVASCSYGIYLVHQSIGYLIEERLAQYGVSPWLWLAAVVASALLLGWTLTVLIERPAFTFLTRRIALASAR